MLGNSIATFVRVTPSPKTLVESSAVFRKLKEYGQVTSFTRGPHYLERANSQLYYAVLANTSPTSSPPLNFDVPVYHGLKDPKDEDPFNIRGLQDRKPYPEPIKFTCTIEPIHSQERRKQVEDYLRTKNPYTEEFRTAWETNDETQTILRETKAPLPLLRGLGRLVSMSESRRMSRSAAEKSIKRRTVRPARSTVSATERSEVQDSKISVSSTKQSRTEFPDTDTDKQIPEVRLRKVHSVSSFGLSNKAMKYRRSR